MRVSTGALAGSRGASSPGWTIAAERARPPTVRHRPGPPGRARRRCWAAARAGGSSSCCSTSSPGPAEVIVSLALGAAVDPTRSPLDFRPRGDRRRSAGETRAARPRPLGRDLHERRVGELPGEAAERVLVASPDGVGDDERVVAGRAEARGGRRDDALERLGDEDGRGRPALLDQDRVVQTARRARPSVAHARDHEVRAGGHVGPAPVGGRTGRAKHDRRLERSPTRRRELSSRACGCGCRRPVTGLSGARSGARHDRGRRLRRVERTDNGDRACGLLGDDAAVGPQSGSNTGQRPGRGAGVDPAPTTARRPTKRRLTSTP
jgi:hypothetical protein